MIITNEQKNNIEKEYKLFSEQMYLGKSKTERMTLAQFFTPSDLTEKLLSKIPFDNISEKIIRDPTCGSGNLLAAAIIIGADPNNVYGNDYDKEMVIACRERLVNVCLTYRKDLQYTKEQLKDLFSWHIHQGDATDEFCLEEFGPDYKEKLVNHWCKGTLFYNMPTEQQILWQLSPDKKAFIENMV